MKRTGTHARFVPALIGTLLLLPVESWAQFYKCVTETGVAYSSRPCPEAAEATVIKAGSEPKQDDCNANQITSDLQRMVVKDALAISEKQQDSQAIHVYLYPFKLSEREREEISVSPEHALSPRHDQSRNPDPNDWDVTPVVEFQFVLKDPAGPVASGNISQWRFVSWMNETPATLDNPGSTLEENFELVEESLVDEQPMLRLKTRSEQTAVDSLYGWELDVTVPLPNIRGGSSKS